MASSNTPNNTSQNIAKQVRDLLPKLEPQTTSMWKDFKSRPGRYVADIARNGAVRFSGGNALFAGFLGQVAGIDMGPAGAFALQTALTVYTSMLQVAATYNGSSPAASYRMQATANFITASLLAANATKDFVAGEVQSASMMALPIATFAAWGKGHWDLANFLDRLTELKSQNKPDEEIKKDLDNDPLLKKFEKKYILAYGAADVVAPWKNMSVQEVANTFGALFSNPAYLSSAQISSLITMPFFLAGLSKDALCNRLPFLKKIFKGKPEAYYAGGYLAGAAASAVHGDFLFAGSQALWALGYDAILNGEKAPSPISADEYAKLQAFMEDPKAVFEVFAESMRKLNPREASNAWNAVSEQMLQLYRTLPEKAVEKKNDTFAILELLAAKSPVPAGANVARKGIQDLADKGDSLAVERMKRVRTIMGSDPITLGPNPRAKKIAEAREIFDRSGLKLAI